jgi:predicted DNA-binding transcriptional regulator AlpA
MKATEDRDNWLTMDDVKRATGLSERSVYRLVEERKIRQESRPVPRRRPLPIFHPGDVAEYQKQMVAAVPAPLVPAPMPPGF